ncbi:unnamed protein product, partial [Durusdinium trenchii]
VHLHPPAQHRWGGPNCARGWRQPRICPTTDPGEDRRVEGAVPQTRSTRCTHGYGAEPGPSRWLPSTAEGATSHDASKHSFAS